MTTLALRLLFAKRAHCNAGNQDDAARRLILDSEYGERV